MGLISQFYTAGLYVFASGIAGGLAAHWWARRSRWTPLLCYAAVAGALLEACAAVEWLLVMAVCLPQRHRGWYVL